MENTGTNTLTVAEEFQQGLKKEYKKNKFIQRSPYIILAVLILGFSLINHDFLSLGNAKIILSQMAIPTVVAMGLTFIILMGSIDLSVDGVMGLTGSVVSLIVLNDKTGLDLGFLGIVLIVLLGGAIGLLSGLIYVKGKIPSFIVTFSTSSIAAGLGLLTYKGIPAGIKSPIFSTMSSGHIFGIPILFCIALLVFLISYFIQEYTPTGRYIYAIGDNEEIPRIAAVNVDRVKLFAFTWSGICMGIAGVMGASRLMRGTITIGTGNLFPAITAVVVGGTSLSGGKGGVFNSLLGALIVTILNNGLILAKINPFIRTGIQGLIIIAAVAISANRSRNVVNK